MRRITRDEIISFVALAPEGRPVFLVEFRDREKLIIKGELRSAKPAAVVRSSYVMSSEIMESAAPSTSMTSEPLSADEYRELESVCEQRNSIEGAVNRSTLYYFRNLRRHTSELVFFKMPYHAEVHDLAALKNGGEMATAFANAVSTDVEGVTSLGQVAAADLFNGNEDRFWASGELGSLNNFFFLLNGGKCKAIGIDFYDVAQCRYDRLPDNWGGRILKCEESMREFAVKAIDSLNEHLTAMTGRAMPLSHKHVDAFLKGMKAGVDGIKQSVSRMKAGVERVPSLVERMNALGWGVTSAASSSSSSS